jgi:hypothetical protein
VALVLTACSTLTRNRVPESANLDEVRAAPRQIRIWSDVVPKNIEAIGRERDTQRRAAGINPSGVMSYPAVSGDGSDGAFGAGLLANGGTTASQDCRAIDLLIDKISRPWRP